MRLLFRIFVWVIVAIILSIVSQLLFIAPFLEMLPFWVLALFPAALAIELYKILKLKKIMRFIATLLLSFVLTFFIIAYFVGVYTHAPVIGTVIIFWVFNLTVLAIYVLVTKRTLQ